MLSQILLVLTATTNSSFAVPGVDFETQIKPILEGRCLSCHGPEQQKGIFAARYKEVNKRQEGKRSPQNGDVVNDQVDVFGVDGHGRMVDG